MIPLQKPNPLDWAYAIQFALAQACMEKKRLTLEETFNLLGASMNLTEFVKGLAGPADGVPFQ